MTIDCLNFSSLWVQHVDRTSLLLGVCKLCSTKKVENHWARMYRTAEHVPQIS